MRERTVRHNWWLTGLGLAALVALLFPARVRAQLPDRSRGRGGVEARDRDMAERARAFFDSQRSESERAAALAAVPGFKEPEQIAQAAAIVRNTSEPPGIRALALSRLQGAVADDAALLSDVLRWLRATDTPVPLRRACLDVVEMALSLPSRHSRHEELVSTLRALSKDSNGEIRSRALKLLAMEGVGRD